MRIEIGIVLIFTLIFFSFIGLIFSPYHLFEKVILVTGLVTLLNAYIVYYLIKAIEKITGHALRIVKYTLWCTICFLYLFTIQTILVLVLPQIEGGSTYYLQSFYFVLMVVSFILIILYYFFLIFIVREVKEFGKIYGFKVEKDHGKVHAKES